MTGGCWSLKRQALLIESCFAWVSTITSLKIRWKHKTSLAMSEMPQKFSMTFSLTAVSKIMYLRGFSLIYCQYANRMRNPHSPSTQTEAWWLFSRNAPNQFQLLYWKWRIARQIVLFLMSMFCFFRPKPFMTWQQHSVDSWKWKKWYARVMARSIRFIIKNVSLHPRPPFSRHRREKLEKFIAH